MVEGGGGDIFFCGRYSNLLFSRFLGFVGYSARARIFAGDGCFFTVAYKKKKTVPDATTEHELVLARVQEWGTFYKKI